MQEDGDGALKHSTKPEVSSASTLSARGIEYDATLLETPLQESVFLKWIGLNRSLSTVVNRFSTMMSSRKRGGLRSGKTARELDRKRD